MPREQIGIEPAEIRRRNLIPPSKLPYTTPTHLGLRLAASSRA